MKTQLGGGVYYRGDGFLIRKFINKKNINENMEFFAKGSYSLVFVNNVSYMPFVSTGLKTFGKNTKQILIKIGVIHEKPDVEFNIYSKTTKQFSKKIFSQTNDLFVGEVEHQKECYKMTNEYLEELCPNIIHAGGFPVDKFEKAFDFSVESVKLKKKPTMMSVIIMELVDDSVPMIRFALYNYDKTQEQIAKCILFHNMARYAVIELAMTTGYVHRDLGLPNILIVPNYAGYYVGTSDSQSYVGRPIIIDFSSAIEIHNLKNEIAEILQGDSSTKFTDALIAIAKIEKSKIFNKHMIFRYDNWEYVGPQGMSGFGWMFNPEFYRTEDKTDDLTTKIEKTNAMLANIHQQRENAKKRTSMVYDGATINFPISNVDKLVDELFPFNDLQVYRPDDMPYKKEDDTDFDVVTIDDPDKLFYDFWKEEGNDKKYGGTIKKTKNKKQKQRKRKTHRQRK